METWVSRGFDQIEIVLFRIPVVEHRLSMGTALGLIPSAKREIISYYCKRTGSYRYYQMKFGLLLKIFWPNTLHCVNLNIPFALLLVFASPRG
jgi:hypothetical protein